ncbi:hypothetical protein JR065_17975 [Xanthomonas sp. AmX2]|uniref:hypothetical protein n=1 Tax=Xanthomonas sp. TaxID=29446 RepID=UPI001980FF05|nr:hypothetical protein [Xanthomonas sp.]MBN6152232.1 hypothetical protein [Xanthomonas sp.]
MALPAAACSVGPPDRFLENETRAFYDADAVLLARIDSCEPVPPPPGRKRWTQRSRYRLIEIYRGARLPRRAKSPPTTGPGPTATASAFALQHLAADPGLVGGNAIVFAIK